MSDIDPAEALLATIGVRGFIYRDVPTVTKEHVARMVGLSATVERLARELCRGELKGVALSDLPYDKTLRDLYEEYQPKELEAIQRALSKNVAELEPAVMAKVGDVVAFLRGIFPRHSFAQLEGQEQLAPDEYEICSFTSVLDALDDPLLVFRGMSNASVLLAQVAAVRNLYPTLSVAIDETVTDTPLTMRAAKASFRIDWNTEIGINKWLGNPPVDPELSALLMQVQAASPMNAPPPPPANTSRSEPQIKGSLSEADRTQFADASGKIA
jgi:hypothetical protein